jgi:hypothetical protein
MNALELLTQSLTAVPLAAQVSPDLISKALLGWRGDPSTTRLSGPNAVATDVSPMPAVNEIRSCRRSPLTRTSLYLFPGCRPLAAICTLSIRPSIELLDFLANARSHLPSFGRSIRTTSEFSRIRSNTISLPSGEISKVRMVAWLRRVS